MEQTSSIKQRIHEVLSDDPLFQIILDTSTEQLFLSESYLDDLIEKKYYSTPEIASWFDVTDAQLRYYIKPFESYIFDEAENNPTTATTFRLNFMAILRLRMILLLKGEYRVKGLKKLLHIDGDGHLIKQIPSTSAANDLVKQFEVLSNVVQQMMQTGLFQMTSHDDESMHMSINQAFLQPHSHLLSLEAHQQLMIDMQKRTEKLSEENSNLQRQLTEMQEHYTQDVAIKIRERQIENELISKLRKEATMQFFETNKPSLFRKLFKTSTIESEKEAFICNYIQQHFKAPLTSALIQYHDEQ